MDTHLWFDPQCAAVFLDHGVEGFDAWMGGMAGEVVSAARDGDVVRLEIGGEVYYVKRRRGEPMIRMLGLLAWGRRPMAGPTRERRMLECLRRDGFPVMEAVGWGEERRLGIPQSAFLVVRAVPGEPVAEVFRSADGRGRAHLMGAVGRLTGGLHARGYFDPLRLKDLIQGADGGLTLIDRESRHPWPRRFSVRAAMGALARTARRTLRDGHRFGPATLRAFLAGYRAGVGVKWEVSAAELRKCLFQALRKELGGRGFRKA